MGAGGVVATGDAAPGQAAALADAPAARRHALRAAHGLRVAGAAAPVRVEIVRRPPGQRGFAVQPRRWVVERTFAWTGRCHRLARDREATTGSALALFVRAAAMVLVRRLERPL